MRRIFVEVFFALLISKISTADNTKLKDVIRNNNNQSNNNRSSNYNINDNDDVFKAEVMKILGECSSKNNRNRDDYDGRRYNGNGDATDSYRRISQNGDYYKNFGYEDNENQRNERNFNNYQRNNRQNNYRNYGNEDANRNGNNGNNRNYNYNSGSYDNQDRSDYDRFNGIPLITCHCPPCKYYQSSSNSYHYSNNDYDRNRNNNGNRGNNNNNNNNNGYDPNNSYNGANNGYNFGYGNNDRENNGNFRSGQSGNTYRYMRQNSRTNTGDDFYGDLSSSFGRRKKRENYDNNNDRNNREDNQCLSQCVFGHMDLLDDEQIPSETLVIKWIQDHIQNDDMKRIKTLREVRKCFTRMSTTAIDDGCDYANELSKCMSLDLN